MLNLLPSQLTTNFGLMFKTHIQISLNSYQQNSTEFIMSSPVFHNSKIKLGGIPIYIKCWYDRGIIFVNEFYDES